jgi:hypothetical protein
MTRIRGLIVRFEFDEDLDADASFQPREGAEDKVEGDAVLELTDEEMLKISQFTAVATRVVDEFVEVVRAQFALIELPARTASDRRKVIYVAHSLLDNQMVNSRRHLGSVAPSHFYLSDFAEVRKNLFIGDAGGAFHAGVAGFTLVVNCASGEVPNYYQEYPSRNVEYILRFPFRGDQEALVQ